MQLGSHTYSKNLILFLSHMENLAKYHPVTYAGIRDNFSDDLDEVRIERIHRQSRTPNPTHTLNSTPSTLNYKPEPMEHALATTRRPSHVVFIRGENGGKVFGHFLGRQERVVHLSSALGL